MLNVQRFILIFLSVMMKCADSTGKLPGHGRPLGAHMKPMGVTAIGKFSSPQVFYGHFVKASRPIHMKSALTEAKHPGLEWTDEYLRDNYGTEMVHVEVGKKEVRGRKAQWMRLNNFLDDYPHKDLYMVHSITDPMKDLVKIPKTLQCGGFERSIMEAVMWMGKGPVRSVLHYDELDNLLCVFDGTKDVILIDQNYKEEVESRGFDHEGRYSTVDTESVDMYSFPQFQSLPWYRVHLATGDCVYIPSNWYHQVTTYGDRSLAINMWFPHVLWFDDETCENFEAFPTFQPIEAFGGFASPNEAVRSRWVQVFEGTDDDISLKDFSSRIPSGTEEHIEQLFSFINQNDDDLLSWEELYLFDINRAILRFPDVFFITSAAQENLSEKVENDSDKQKSDETPSGGDAGGVGAASMSNEDMVSQNRTVQHRHTRHEEL